MSRKLFVFEWFLVGVPKVRDTQTNLPIKPNPKTMKTTVTQAQPPFQPISINITLESQKELELLCQVLIANVRIPSMLVNEDYIKYEDRNKLTNMMAQIYRGELQKYFIVAK
jgi:hypothetical protein